MLTCLLLLALADAGRAQAPAPPPEMLTEIRVHGNVATPDDEVERLAGVAIGAPFTPAMVEEVGARLRATHRFQHVEVLKRFASIADPSQICLLYTSDAADDLL